MGPPCNPSSVHYTSTQCEDTIEELHHEPQEEDEEGRHSNNIDEKEEEDEKINAGPGKADEIGAKYARNCPTCSHHRHSRVGNQDVLDQCSSKATCQVEEEKSRVTKPILYIVSEDPQVPHVSNDMEPASMEEHMGKKGLCHIRKVEPRDPRKIGYQVRDQTMMVEEDLKAAAEAHLIEEDEAVCRDQGDGDEREGA